MVCKPQKNSFSVLHEYCIVDRSLLAVKELTILVMRSGTKRWVKIFHRKFKALTRMFNIMIESYF